LIRFSKKATNRFGRNHSEGEKMKKASIIGLGDILKGDLGVGCYIIDALEQEQLDDSIHLAYLADDPRYAGGLLYEADFAVIVAAVSM